ncbi:MAG: DUF1800 domain-containing protein [Dyadobacter sp.]|uniref:DUF1800 domain-containing protein n=1 Tax=Dyadobacter sp. TaxID=1914288 RepID=UPI0032671555
MEKIITISAYLLYTLCGWMLLSSFLNKDVSVKPDLHFPYKQEGLTEKQAAAHLLNRFTYGATPGQIDQVVHQGLEKWFRSQLTADFSDDTLTSLLKDYDALQLTNTQVSSMYLKPGQVIRMAVKDGLINKDSVKTDSKEYRAMLQNYMQQQGLKPVQELYRQFVSQKVLRAAYSQNQLQEVMTSFWFNHFNVSITKNDCAPFIPAYERDVIRPNALGNFGGLLLATAQSPAMLYFLDNFSSSVENNDAMAKRNSAWPRQKKRANLRQNGSSVDSAMAAIPPKPKRARGLNENYAREVMELHTMGVDGGYSQQDVTQAARILTGWTVYPMGVYVRGAQKAMDNLGGERLKNRGMIHDGDFLFIANRHDRGEKTVLGRKFGPDGGYQEGVDLLDMLAHHNATAKFISKKLAVRFVSDTPPEALIDKMAKTFLDQRGDIKAVLTAMVNSREFWNKTAVRQKTKSPFELAIGAVRTLNAEIRQPYQLYSWVTKMGEKMYYYQAPTGFPDRAQYWINTGALLNRMNFGLALASGRIPGIRVDLADLNNHREPESAQAALVSYCKLIMPERDLTQTIERLSPMMNDPLLMEKVDKASHELTTANTENQQTDHTAMKSKQREKFKKKNNYTAPQTTNGNNTVLAQAVGVIIGSPEYQKR